MKATLLCGKQHMKMILRKLMKLKGNFIEVLRKG